MAQGSKKKKLASLATQFSEQLGELVATMQQCNPFFVRCIKPNTVKKPGIFDNVLVLEQLRYSGMLETIRIRRAGYPVRLLFADFEFRFRSLITNKVCTTHTHTHTHTHAVIAFFIRMFIIICVL